MTNHHIDVLIGNAEKEVSSSSFAGAWLVGGFSLLISPLVLVEGVNVIAGMMAMVGWIATCSLLSDGRKGRVDVQQNRARSIWDEFRRSDAFGASESLKVRELTREIARVYEIDPQGEVLPISQAVRLVLVWKQQQECLQLIIERLGQMRVLRETLLSKQRLLHDLNDHNSGVERTIARLNDDIEPLDRSCDAFLASCARLEAMISSVEAQARRRQLHREIGQLTTQVIPGPMDSLELSNEHLDLERQITREIETFLQLERETDAHLREL